MQACARHTRSCMCGRSTCWECLHTPRMWGWGSQDALCLPTHLSSQVVAGGQVLEAVEAVPVASSSTARVVVDHLGEAGRNAWEERCRPRGLWEGGSAILSGPLAAEGLRGDGRCVCVCWGGDLPPGRGGALTSTSQRALELVADVADWRSVVRRNTCSLPLYSSHVRNFSCSAWNSRTTSPCRRAVGSGRPGTLPAGEPPPRPVLDTFQSQQVHRAQPTPTEGGHGQGKPRVFDCPPWKAQALTRQPGIFDGEGMGQRVGGLAWNCGEAWVRGESAQRICAHGPFPENKVSSARTGSGWSRGFKARDREEASWGGWERPCGVGWAAGGMEPEKEVRGARTGQGAEPGARQVGIGWQGDQEWVGRQGKGCPQSLPLSAPPPGGLGTA